VANSKLLQWQETALIFLVAALGSFAAAAILFTYSKPKTANKAKAPANSSTSVEIVRRDRVVRDIIAQVQQEIDQSLLNFKIPAQFQGTTLNDIKLNSSEKVVALTFDDGPWPSSTVAILEILKRNNIKATFFWVGEPLEDFPQIAKQVVAEGHAIGNHTWHHWYHKMSPEVVQSEIERTNELIYKTTGVKTGLFRPPGGVLTNGLADYVMGQKNAVIMWSSDSIDYRRPSVPVFLNNVLRNTAPGGIILMHDGGGDRSQTVKALPELIADLKQQGYRFVTVAELLKMREKENQTTTATQPPNADANSQAKISQKN